MGGLNSGEIRHLHFLLFAGRARSFAGERNPARAALPGMQKPLRRSARRHRFGRTFLLTILAGVRPAGGCGSCSDASPLYLRMVSTSDTRPEAFCTVQYKG